MSGQSMYRGSREVAELRWDPVLREWVLVSNIRRMRPWQPQTGCPFCPGAPETGYGWDVLILENRYPMLREDPPEPTRHYFYKTARAVGRCYVVVETPVHDIDDLSDLSIDEIERVLTKISEKMREEMTRPYARYFLWFRNKGVEIGVSLTHPHSQIYVLPIVPSRVAREVRSARRYWRERGRCLFCDILEVEERDRRRVLYENRWWVSFMPFYSHWPYEAHIYPRRHVGLLTDLSREEVRDLADILKKTLCGLKRLFPGKPSPYMMVMHQAPLRGGHPYYHLHIEVYGVQREEGRLKYAAGMEHGGGNFTYDYDPEENAERLRASIEKCVQRDTT